MFYQEMNLSNNDHVKAWQNNPTSGCKFRLYKCL